MAPLLQQLRRKLPEMLMLPLLLLLPLLNPALRGSLRPDIIDRLHLAIGDFTPGVMIAIAAALVFIFTALVVVVAIELSAGKSMTTTLLRGAKIIANASLAIWNDSCRRLISFVMITSTMCASEKLFDAPRQSNQSKQHRAPESCQHEKKQEQQKHKPLGEPRKRERG